jgi:hypothetical protein
MATFELPLTRKLEDDNECITAHLTVAEAQAVAYALRYAKVQSQANLETTGLLQGYQSPAYDEQVIGVQRLGEIDNASWIMLRRLQDRGWVR